MNLLSDNYLKSLEFKISPQENKLLLELFIVMQTIMLY